MTSLLFPEIKIPTLAVAGEDALFPVNRIFCVGRNYAAHAAEMGSEIDREAPWYFCKLQHAVVHAGDDIPYPPMTQNYHYEVELTVAIGTAAFEVSIEDAQHSAYAYGLGLDMTRRDLQAISKDKRRPWDTGKNVEGSAVLTSLVKVADFGELPDKHIHLSVNGAVKQDATLADMVWSVPEIVSHLSHLYHLEPGDLIMTGTPAGVGPVKPGDVITAGLDGAPSITGKVV